MRGGPNPLDLRQGSTGCSPRVYRKQTYGGPLVYRVPDSVAEYGYQLQKCTPLALSQMANSQWVEGFRFSI